MFIFTSLTPLFILLLFPFSVIKNIVYNCICIWLKQVHENVKCKSNFLHFCLSFKLYHKINTFFLFIHHSSFIIIRSPLLLNLINFTVSILYNFCNQHVIRGFIIIWLKCNHCYLMKCMNSVFLHNSYNCTCQIYRNKVNFYFVHSSYFVQFCRASYTFYIKNKCGQTGKLESNTFYR